MLEKKADEEDDCRFGLFACTKICHFSATSKWKGLGYSANDQFLVGPPFKVDYHTANWATFSSE